MDETETKPTKKLPYNLRREKKAKVTDYHNPVSPELADELYDKILNIIVAQKKYRESNYSVKDLAKDLKTNIGYVSAVINSRFHMRYSCLLNEYRIKDSKHFLVDKRYQDKTIEEISTMVGFANRQSFYSSFFKLVGITPRAYRLKYGDK